MTRVKSKTAARILCGAMIGIVSSRGLAPAAAAGPTSRPVEQQLKVKADAGEKRSPENARIFSDGIAAVAATGIVQKARKVGDKAELFELPDATGQMIKLSDLLGKGPVVLTWYRGGWCPYCNIALRDRRGGANHPRTGCDAGRHYARDAGLHRKDNRSQRAHF